MVLTWDPSADGNAQYFVYRNASASGPLSSTNRLTATPINLTTFTDTAPPSGAKSYAVRALNVVTSGSGSYTNLSQGAFTTLSQ